MELLRDAMRHDTDCPGFLIDGFPRELQQGLQFEQEVSPPMFITLGHCYICLSTYNSQILCLTGYKLPVDSMLFPFETSSN